MSASELVKVVCNSAKARGISMSMHKGWDVVARLLYGKSYSQAIAAERAGKLPPATLSSSRTQEQRKGPYGKHVDALVGIATELFEFPSCNAEIEEVVADK